MKLRTWLALIVLVALTLAIVAVPVVLIRPFSPQTDAAVGWAYALRRASPIVSLAAALILAGALVLAWRRTRWIGRAGLVLMTAIAIGLAWFARQNHFEWMFRPAQDARFVPAADAADVAPEELVIAAAIEGDALAFPVRRIGYHHIVNTTAGREPIVATY